MQSDPPKLTIDGTDSSTRWNWVLLVVGVVAQHALFYVIAAANVQLRYICHWVEWAPIALIWALYWLAPFVYVRPISVETVLRSCVSAGWIFVAAAVCWFVMFDVLGELYGSPLSSRSVDPEASSIRETFLRGKPMGSSREEVKAYLEEHHGLDQNYDGATHGIHREVGKPNDTVGASSLHGHFGGFIMSVDAYWAFDQNERLIEVKVYKSGPSL